MQSAAPAAQGHKHAKFTKVESSDSYLSSLKESPETKPKLAIIVPFRDSDPKQHRKAHLDKFVPSMISFLVEYEANFKIFIIEQSEDGRKFNRGKLLNYGYKVARDEDFDTLVFHDVDLLPSSKEIAPWYYLSPRPRTVHHIARCWSRYSKSPTYIGGALSIRVEDFERVGGFPNTYWGWGGEDDEFSKRVQSSNMRVEAPAADSSTDGWLVDLEAMNLQEKLAWLRENHEVKCGVKWEVNDVHKERREDVKLPPWWGVPSGIEMCQELDREVCGPKEERVYAERVRVDLGPNFEEDGTEYWMNKEDVTASKKE